MSYLPCVYNFYCSDPSKVLNWNYLKINLWRRTSLCWIGSETEELWQRYSCQVIGALVIVILSSPQTMPRVWDFCRWVYWVWVKKKSKIFEQECIKASFGKLLKPSYFKWTLSQFFMSIFVVKKSWKSKHICYTYQF